MAYVAVAFVGLQAMDLLIPSTTLPAWADEFMLALLVVGFPVALVVAWAFEMTPDGVRRTPRPEGEGVPPAQRTESGEAPAPDFVAAPGSAGPADGLSRMALKALMGVGLLAGGVVGVWYLTGAGGGQSGGVDADRSVAVLPFETLGRERASAFTDGIQTGVLTRLSKVAALEVTSRTSVMRFRRPEEPLPRIAGELGVRWIVRGEVQETTDQVQVSARLVNAADDRQVWAESYRRRLTAENVFAIQEEIAMRIAEALETRLTPAEARRVAERPTADLDAYRLYVAGRSQLDRRTEAGVREAVALFGRAIERDSSYALAWSGLSDALSILHYYHYAPADSVSDASLAAARRAVELNPTSGEAHASLGITYSLRGEGPEALEELRRAVELTPSYAEAYAWLGWLQLRLGNPEQALDPARRSVELGPLAPAYHVFLAHVQLANGQLTDALREARRAREIQPEYGLTHFMEGLVLHHLGRHAEASRSLERSRSLVPERGTPSHAEIDAALAATRSAAGDTTEARALLSRVDASTDPFSRGLIHAAVGEIDLAFAAFRDVERWERFSPEHARYSFPGILGPLREDPRYGELLSRVNRAMGLEADGSLPGEDR